MLIQRYEELVADPVTAVVRSPAISGSGSPAVRRPRSPTISRWNRIRRGFKRLGRRLESAGIGILTPPGNLRICDPVTLLLWSHLRPGGTGS